MNIPLLGVNIDHVATLRNARGVNYPCPVQAAQICQEAGADGITLHLREDRRHIKDDDVYAIKQAIDIPMNLEMALTDEMLAIACDVRPDWVCLVPEKRSEVTTEGGLDVLASTQIERFIAALQNNGIRVSLFLDPNTQQIAKAMAVGADAIEIHTGAYANAFLANNKDALIDELNRIKMAAAFARSKHPSFLVNAGHGLTVANVAAIAQIDGIHELNIGHALIADAVFIGLPLAVQQMKQAFGQPIGTDFTCFG